MILKNVAGQGVYLFCVETSTSPYVGTGGDQANITGHYSLDGVAETSFATTNPTNIAGGVYWQPLSQAETNGNAYSYRWTSTTSGNVINPIFGFTDSYSSTVLAAFPPNFVDLSIDAGNGGVKLISTGLDLIIKDTYTIAELIELIAAQILGKISGLPVSPATARSVNDTVDRVVTHFDANNNRTSVTLTP